MAWIMLPDLLASLRKLGINRNDEDLKIIYYNLRRLHCLSSVSDVELFVLCRQVRYQCCEAKSILYRQHELAHCWYILVSGSVYIDGAVFVPPSSIGERAESESYRLNDCVTLEPTGLIVIFYPDCEQYAISLSKLYVSDEKPKVECRNAASGDESSKTADELCDDDDSMMLMSMLEDNTVDSDSEDVCNESYEPVVIRDAVHEVLEKPSNTRTEEDIEIILDFMQNLSAFSNMTVAIRRALCAVMEYKVIEKVDTVLYTNEQLVSSWFAILNGLIEITYPDGSSKELHAHDSFDLTAAMDDFAHCGVMRTKTVSCQLVFITHTDFRSILNQGVANTSCVEEQGKTVLVREKRTISRGTKTGHVVIRGTPEKLIAHLVEDHSAVDPTYVEDFLLTYRTFLSSPLHIANKMLEWFTDSSLRDKVIRVVLLWVNNHFRDFEVEPSMGNFLEQFASLLEQQNLEGQLLLLRLACSANSHSRQVELCHTSEHSIWPPFKLILGQGVECTSAFITRVDASVKESGLRRGDQICEINQQHVDSMSHQQLLHIINSSMHLALVVRCNFKDLYEVLKHHRDANGCDKAKDESQYWQTNNVRTKNDRAKSASSQHSAKLNLYKALQPLLKLTSLSKADSSSNSTTSETRCTLPRHSRLRPTSSDPDLTRLDTVSSSGVVIRIYLSDESYVSILVNQEMTAGDVITEALHHFGIDDLYGHYQLHEVSEEHGASRRRRILNYVSNLNARCAQNVRFYLINSSNEESLWLDSLSTNNQSPLLRLNATELGALLTERDFQLFRNIEPTEYLDDLFSSCSNKFSYGMANLTRFSELANCELFWVATEICSETNIVRRVRVIQHFLKIARHCQESNNFNSLFAIIGGLGHHTVSRLRQTWERLPTKYSKMFKGMQTLMDPTRNMSNYRNVLSVQLQQSPAIPFFPVVKKDLTFIHLGNDSKVDGLVNFEKLRMMAKEIRHVCHMALKYYHRQTVNNDSPGPATLPSATLPPSNISIFATLNKKRSLSSSYQSAKKTSEEDEMRQQVRLYLDGLPGKVIVDENKLMQMSHTCEPPATESVASHIGKKQDPVVTNPSSIRPPVSSLPKFGTESTQAVQKLMSLTDRIRPHDSKKHPLPAPAGHTRPTSLPATPHMMRQSSPVHRQVHASPVHLSAESSSVSGRPRNIHQAHLEAGKPGAVTTRHSYGDGQFQCKKVTSTPPTGRLSAPVSPCHHQPVADYESAVDMLRHQNHTQSQHSRVRSLDSTNDTPKHDSDVETSAHNNSSLRFSRWHWRTSESSE